MIVTDEEWLVYSGDDTIGFTIQEGDQWTVDREGWNNWYPFAESETGLVLHVPDFKYRRKNTSLPESMHFI